jgi:two-component system nitrogen regulation response regulator GlnG
MKGHFLGFVLIMTGSAGNLSAGCRIKAGAWDYIPKPFDNNKVLELVNQPVKTVQLS